MAFAALTVAFVVHPRLWLMVAVTIVGLALGWHLVASIGGGDMPVVVSMTQPQFGLGSSSGGILAQQPSLIITGALVDRRVPTCRTSCARR